jgi:hypothetical protein
MNGRRFSVPILLMLAAAAGGALALMVGALAIELGPWADRKAEPGACHCDEPGTTGGTDASRQAQLVDQNVELRRALLAALARGSGCDDTAVEPSAPPSPADLVEENDFVPPSPEEIAAQQKTEMASLQKELNEEPVDPVWAPRTEEAAARAVAATESMQLEGVECRESLCRVRVTHRDVAKREDDVEKLLAAMPVEGQARVYAPTDETTTEMYFSRKGMRLSVLSPPVPRVPPPDSVEGESSPPGPLSN